ncbi:MAG: hypothetical protein H7831_18870 [Magnetococcus sp. WYHC-3]
MSQEGHSPLSGTQQRVTVRGVGTGVLLTIAALSLAFMAWEVRYGVREGLVPYLSARAGSEELERLRQQGAQAREALDAAQQQLRKVTEHLQAEESSGKLRLAMLEKAMSALELRIKRRQDLFHEENAAREEEKRRLLEELAQLNACRQLLPAASPPTDTKPEATPP